MTMEAKHNLNACEHPDFIAGVETMMNADETDALDVLQRYTFWVEPTTGVLHCSHERGPEYFYNEGGWVDVNEEGEV